MISQYTWELRHRSFPGGIYKYTRWWFQISFIFHRETWGRWTHFDEHIFHWGWFNHQQDDVWFEFVLVLLLRSLVAMKRSSPDLEVVVSKLSMNYMSRFRICVLYKYYMRLFFCSIHPRTTTEPIKEMVSKFGIFLSRGPFWGSISTLVCFQPFICISHLRGDDPIWRIFFQRGWNHQLGDYINHIYRDYLKPWNKDPGTLNNLKQPGSV